MSSRTTGASAVLACVLLPTGVALLVSGASAGHDGRTVGGIVLTLLGMVCLRILVWARRIRLMTEVGLRLHTERHVGDENHP